ncbi:MAG: type III secretion system chaperone [Phormidesmis sp.]
MNRKFIVSVLGAAGLSLLIGQASPILQVSPVQAQSQAQADMTVTQLDAILRDAANDVEGSNGQWQLTMEGRDLLVLADATNNRMRIVAPIVSANELSGEQVQSMLLANFHTALDARYALSNGTVVSVFVHPLASLDENYLRSALVQVATAANNFGTSYSSGGIGFGPNQQSAPSSSGDRLSI